MGSVLVKVVVSLAFLLSSIGSLSALSDTTVQEKIPAYLERIMHEANIPGLSVVVVSKGELTMFNYGYADLETNKKVNSKTLFQLGSCSKAFTALSILKLERDGRIDLDDHVSKYIPWFNAQYKNLPVPITLRQLLHHTSGIPWNTISKIPSRNDEDALEQTIRNLAGVKLREFPGKEFEYATINYDVLALIIEKVTGGSFEVYVQDNLLTKLKLNYTTVGMPVDSSLLAEGYKIGFFKPREYSAPVFRGNNAAGYVISNAEDIATWLKFQMGLIHSEMYDLAQATHQRDESVPLHDMSSYAMGWDVSLNGNGEIYHSGLNPNYSSYIAFRPTSKLGVVVLANSNSSFTPVIGNTIMKLLANEEIKKEYDPGNGHDKVFTIVSYILGTYTLIVIAFLILMITDIVKGRRRYEGFSIQKLSKLAGLLFILAPFLFGLYILPEAMAGFTWEAIIVWLPLSFLVALLFVLGAISLSYFVYGISLCFSESNRYKNIIPRLILLSILSSLANMVVVILITSSLDSTVELKYLVFYYLLALSVYLLGRRFVQVNLIRLTMGVIYELRVKLIDKIFSTSYQRFEKIDRGRIYTALNDDVSTIGESTNMIVTLVTSFFTAVGAFIYLASIAFWAAILTLLLVLTLTTLYYFVSRSTNKYYEEARNTRNVFMQLINGMIDGFKEISLHRNKKQEYSNDVAASANEYKVKMSSASVRFVNASLVGETILIGILGAVVFAFPTFFPGIKSYTLMSFVIVLIYLIGPVNALLSSVPGVMRLRIAWNRVQQLLAEIPANIELKKIMPLSVSRTVHSIKAEAVKFQYKEQDQFSIGPIDFEVKKGEILFIIGGNGSGKTTLIKLLTGLYEPDQGAFKINNNVANSSQLGEHFSAVFSPVYLFQKLYNVQAKDKLEEVQRYLNLLKLEDKVGIKENEYTTINLSGGQRKRLTLLQCYLEDSPIFLFDEWAADQDPHYRQFFYRTLLPQMRDMGKIVIAVTHDDHYFDVADKVLKMNRGKLEVYSHEDTLAAATSIIKYS